MLQNLPAGASDLATLLVTDVCWVGSFTNNVMSDSDPGHPMGFLADLALLLSQDTSD